MSSQPDSALLALPAELQNQIFEDFVISRDPTTGELRPIRVRSLPFAQNKLQSIRIVCKSFNNYMQPMFYGQNLFQLEQNFARDGTGLLRVHRYAAGSNLEVLTYCHNTQYDGHIGHFNMLLPAPQHRPLIKNVLLILEIPGKFVKGDSYEGRDLTLQRAGLQQENTDWMHMIHNLMAYGFQQLDSLTVKFNAYGHSGPDRLFDVTRSITRDADLVKSVIETFVNATPVNANTVKLVFPEGRLIGEPRTLRQRI